MQSLRVAEVHVTSVTLFGLGSHRLAQSSKTGSADQTATRSSSKPLNVHVDQKTIC